MLLSMNVKVLAGCPIQLNCTSPQVSRTYFIYILNVKITKIQIPHPWENYSEIPNF